MSKKHMEHDLLHGYTGCGCQRSMLSQMVGDAAGMDPSRREFLKRAGAFGGLLVFGGLLGDAGAMLPALPADAVADTIYHGGPILTMADASGQVEAVAVVKGRILATGKLVKVMERKGPTTRMIDLAGKTLLPGFIDPHSHIAGYELLWGTPDLSPPPISDVTSIADIQKKMRAFIEEKKIPAGTMVLASGYDEGLMVDKRHPTKQDLDEISTKHPVVTMHTSQPQIIEKCRCSPDAQHISTLPGSRRSIFSNAAFIGWKARGLQGPRIGGLARKTNKAEEMGQGGRNRHQDRRRNTGKLTGKIRSPFFPSFLFGFFVSSKFTLSACRQDSAIIQPHCLSASARVSSVLEMLPA